MLALLLATLTGCNDDLKYSSTKIEEGRPATFTIAMKLPGSSEVQNLSRAPENAESQIKNLKLVMFAESGRREILDIDPNQLIPAAPDELGGRDYTLEGSITSVTSGVYNTYIFANYGTKFASAIDDNSSHLTTDNIEDLILNMPDLGAGDEYDGSYINITDDNFIPMTGRAKILIEAGNGTGGSDDNPQKIRFTLERVMSRIEITFVNGNNKVEFVPTSYTVYNLPKSVCAFRNATFSETKDPNYNVYPIDKWTLKELWGENGLQANAPTASDYFNVTEPQRIIDKTFSFLMFANHQGEVDGITYHQRDAWDHTETKDNLPDNVTLEKMDPSQKHWKYAPQYSTFVVVEGSVSAERTEGAVTNNYSGTLYYTLHLGNFNNTVKDEYGKAGSQGNFNVNRNELHKYTITVNGIENFIADVNINTTEQEEVNPGVEGNVTKTTNLFILDAHYETVMLKFTESDITAIKNNKTTNTVSVKSPATGFAYEDYNLADLQLAHEDKQQIRDVHWIQFMKPVKNGNTIEFPKYVGWKMDDNGNFVGEDGHTLIQYTESGHRVFNKAFDPEETYNPGEEDYGGYLSDFLNYPEAFCVIGSDGNYYTACFVDEYVYNNEQNAVSRQYELYEYVNTPNRVIVVNRSDRKQSLDLRSSIYEYNLFEIQQRSIKTTMNVYTARDAQSNVYNNIFGIETWDETSCYDPNYWGNDGANYASKTYPDGAVGVLPYVGYKEDFTPELSSIYGLYNTLVLYDYSNDNKLKIDPDYYKTMGYTTAPKDNTAQSHVWSKSVNVRYRKNAMTSVLARNRDLNGSGSLDRFEIRWYLPAIEQYYTIWFGQQYLTEDTRLFDTNDYFNGHYLEHMDARAKHFTSSGKNALIYWADQGASFTAGSSFDGALSGNGWLGSARHYVRACRNLPDYRDHAQFPATNYTTTNSDETGVRGYILVGGLGNVREYDILGFYDFHTERQENNWLPRAFEVSIQVDMPRRMPAVNSSGNETIDVSKFTDDGENVSQHPGYEYMKRAYKAALNNNGILRNQSGWRIPNQRELMLLEHFGYLDNNDNTAYYTCTWFTERSTRRFPFNYRVDINLWANGYNRNQIKCVFVRDYQGNIDDLQNLNNNESYDNGGFGFGVPDNQ